MVDEVLKAYEMAARIYCEKRNLDPEQMLPAPTDSIVLTNETELRPLWQFVAMELHDLSLRLVAMKEAAESKALVRVQ